MYTAPCSPFPGEYAKGKCWRQFGKDVPHQVPIRGSNFWQGGMLFPQLLRAWNLAVLLFGGL